MTTLTVGCACYDDFDGVYFTLQAMRLYQDVHDVQFMVIDNFGCGFTRDFVKKWIRNGIYVQFDANVGTSASRDLIFKLAKTDAVLCVDCHVLLASGALYKLKQYYDDNPNSLDLLQGPLLSDDMIHVSTHFNPVWNDHMWGVWGTDPRGVEIDSQPFEIPMQGLGLFSCRKAAWQGFNPQFRGFGGEEGYIHEKFRQAGHKCLCLPWLRWGHRFVRPYGTPYPLNIDDRIRNYLIGHDELNLDIQPIFRHFNQYVDRTKLIAIAQDALGTRDFEQYF